MRSIRDQSGEVHGFENSGIAAIVSQRLLTFDGFGNKSEIGDAYAEDAIGGHAMTCQGFAELLTTLPFQIGHDGCGGWHFHDDARNGEMNIEFCKVSLPEEIRSLMAFDRKSFLRADWFRRTDWERYECYWMIKNGARAGCCAFEHDVDFREDKDDQNPPRAGSLYISTTAVLPRFRGKGLGDLLKCWQVAYAREQGFRRIVTNVRKSNRQMIRLNAKFGFSILRTSQKYYYADPPESTIVMELKFGRASVMPRRG